MLLPTALTFDGHPITPKSFPRWDSIDLIKGDVTPYVTGNGAYNFTTSSVSNAYSASLLVIYSLDTLPLTEIRIREHIAYLDWSLSYLSAEFYGVESGPGRLLTMFCADDPSRTGETITFNDTVVDGPIDGNLGPAGSIFSNPVTTVNGMNTVGVQTLEDAMWWHLAILISRAKPKVTFPAPSLINGKVRICAGAINDEVHTATVPVEAKLSSEPSANTSLTFSFDTSGIDYTHCKLPKFIDDDGNQVATLTRITDAEGKTSIKVLSSDLISQPKIIAKWTNEQGDEVEVGNVTCDFAAAQSIRRYGIKDLDQGYKNRNDELIDLGWDFDDLLMQEEGDTTDATVSMKFRKNPSDALHPIDQNYFLINGSPKPSLDTGDGLGGPPDGWVDDDEYDAGQIRGLAPQPLLDDHDNWLPVAGHQLYVRIAAIEDLDYGPVDPADFAQYAVFDSNGGNAISATTDSQGKAVVRLRAGPWIYWCRSIKLEAVNLTQKSWTGINASTGW